MCLHSNVPEGRDKSMESLREIGERLNNAICENRNMAYPADTRGREEVIARSHVVCRINPAV
jgi:hypothetical protein